MVSINDIISAKDRLKNYIICTPLVTCKSLNDQLGHTIYFKMDCLQHIRAFKARGAHNTVLKLIEEGKKPESVVAYSSGNHAQGVAWAAAKLGISATLFIPSDAS